MNLTAQNTAVVLDSTADFPEAAERFPNWRMVPLYVRFGDETYRDYIELGPREFYERLRTSPTTPATSQPTPGDFAATYTELSGYERILSIHIPESLSGTIQSARVAAEDFGDKVRDDRLGHGVGGGGDARLCDPAPARARHDRRGGRRARHALQGERRDSVHRRHARVPPARRADRARGEVRRAAAAREADPHDRGRRGDPAEARAWCGQGVRRVSAAVHRLDDRHRPPPRRHRARRRARARRSSSARWLRASGRRRRSRS